MKDKSPEFLAERMLELHIMKQDVAAEGLGVPTGEPDWTYRAREAIEKLKRSESKPRAFKRDIGEVLVRGDVVTADEMSDE